MLMPRYPDPALPPGHEKMYWKVDPDHDAQDVSEELGLKIIRISAGTKFTSVKSKRDIFTGFLLLLFSFSQSILGYFV